MYSAMMLAFPECAFQASIHQRYQSIVTLRQVFRYNDYIWSVQFDQFRFMREINMKIEWIDGFEIKTVVENDEILISANREGLLSLAKQLAALANGVPGDHIHYDEYNSLEKASAEMTIEKKG